MRRLVNVYQIAVGTSPDHEGVVIRLNPEKPDEVFFTLTPEVAIKVADSLRETVTELSQHGQSTRPRTADSHSIIIAREPGGKLDS
jgi:hypothetical protein